MRTENKSKYTKPIDEKSPLLPRRQEEEEVAFDEFNGASVSGAVFNLSTTIVGAGIMALPATMKVIGLVPGIAMIIFMAFLTEASIEFILRFGQEARVASYGGLMGDAFGKFGRVLYQVIILINVAGTLIVYMIIIGDVLSGTSASGVHHAGVLEGWFGEHWWTGRAFVLLVTTLAIFLPLGFFKRIDSLRHSSALSVGLAFVLLVTTVGISIFKLISGGVAMPKLFPDVTDLASFWKLFTVAPVLVSAYVCHFNVQTVENELEDHTQMRTVVKASLALCSTVYIMISAFAFILFGDSTLDDMLANFDTDLGVPYSSVINDVVRVSYAIHLIFVYPLLFYPLRLSLDGLLFPSKRPLVLDNYRFASITIGLVSLIYLVAIFVPSIWDAIQFNGATTAIFISYVFPGAIALRDRHNIAAKKDKILASVMILLAVFSSFVAIYINTHSLFKKDSK